MKRRTLILSLTTIAILSAILVPANAQSHKTSTKKRTTHHTTSKAASHRVLTSAQRAAIAQNRASLARAYAGMGIKTSVRYGANNPWINRSKTAGYVNPQSLTGTGIYVPRYGYRIMRNGWLTPGTYNRANYRSGYYASNANWNDSTFAYNGYVQEPGIVNVAVSPGYYYPQMPGYIDLNGVWVDTNTYSYTPQTMIDPDVDPQSPINSAVRAITAAFLDSSRAGVAYVTQPYNPVEIWLQGRYAYTMSPADFRNVLMDTVTSTPTINYQITSVSFDSMGAVQVNAQQQYQDPWGQSRIVNHTFLLKSYREGYGIVKFGISR